MASSSSSSSSWMPVHGVQQVNIGTSLRRALKARRNNGEQRVPAPVKRLPDRDFYAFRYNFKPNSIDSEKPGNIDIRKTPDSTSITVEYPSKQSGETHVFRGTENVAKGWDCVLVYDEELGTFTLEKLDSHAALTHERRPIAGRPPPPPSPKPPSQNKVKDELEAQLEKDLLELADPDADGEYEYEDPPPRDVPYHKEEEEEDPIAELISATPPPIKQAPPRQKVPAKAPTKPPQPQRPEKPIPKNKGKAPAVPRPSSAVPDKPPAPAAKPIPPKHKPTPARATAPISAPVPASVPPAAPPQTKPPKKRETESTHLSDVDEEVLEFGKPAKRSHKLVPATVPAPAPPASSGLALPGTSSSVAPPPPVRSASSSTSSSSTRPLASAVSQHSAHASTPALPAGVGGESESDDEWDEVDPETAIQDDDFFGDGMVEVDGGEEEEEEQGEDIDEDELKAQMEQQMAEFEEEDMEAEVPRGPPISLNDYARGMVGEMGLSDDDTSTSEDSDDD
ncbi:hypothetical protein AX15_003843 [Amanita polypyramis BW_CC]|nr:hypothetical protein AX15_003843 [Amanita polypyramis BW_CC]